MTTITVRNVGAYGFYTTPLNGIGLSTAEAANKGSDVEQALALADALRDAMRAAREAGLQAFAPAQAVAAGLLVLPANLSTANREEFFAEVMGRAYAGGPASLDQWSQAVDELEHYAGVNASMLPPGAGGGTRNVRGTWYVNGEPWSLSELFTVNRVNTLSEIDRMVAESLNVIAANNQEAKGLTLLMQKLFRKHKDNLWDTAAYSKVNYPSVEFMGQSEPTDEAYQEGNQGGAYYYQSRYQSGASEYPYPFSRLLAAADKHIGPNSLIRKLYDLGGAAFDANLNPVNNGFQKEDFRAMIDEVEQIVGAFAADNQVAQLRNETLFNSRSNLLEGLGTFLKGQQTVRTTVARNA